MHLTTSPLIEALGWTLLHFVWQGGLIAVLLACLLSCISTSAPNLRYGLACAALLIMAGISLVTLGLQIKAVRSGLVPGFHAAQAPAITARQSRFDSHAAVAHPAMLGDGSRAASMNGRTTSFWALPWIDTQSFARELRPCLPKLVALWALGVGVLALRISLSWRTVKRLHARGHEIQDAYWTNRLEHLQRRFGIKCTVRLLSSAQATVPFVLGWLKPTILLPAELLTGLNREELQAILIHELIHIRRHDYLVNLGQSAFEVVFFYHPAGWWVSGQIRQEREHCCDEIAAAQSGGVLGYAKTLAKLERLCGLHTSLRVAASGGSLVQRVRRLLRTEPSRSQRSTGPLLAFVFCLTLGLAIVARQQPLVGFEHLDGPRRSIPGAATTKAELDDVLQADATRVRDTRYFDREQAATWYHRGDDIRLVIYHRGFLQSAMEYKEWADGWQFRGKVAIPGKRAFPIFYSSNDINRLLVGDQSLDLRDGRVIVLTADEAPKQLAVVPPAPKKDNLPVLGDLIAAGLQAQE